MNAEDQDGMEDGQGGALAVADPVKELSEYRELLLKPEALLEPQELDPSDIDIELLADPAKLERAVESEPQLAPAHLAPVEEDEYADCTAEERERLRGLVKVASRLQGLTGWTRALLLDNIGCEERDTKALVKDAEHTERCTRFLQTLLDAAERVDSARACQAVVRRCARLSKGLDVEQLRQALRAGDPSALDYISLGEMSTAIRVARIAAGREKAASASGPSPYDSADAVHLSTPRIDLFVQGKRDALGQRAYASMEAHVASCSACERAVETRRSLIYPD